MNDKDDTNISRAATVAHEQIHKRMFDASKHSFQQNKAMKTDQPPRRWPITNADINGFRIVFTIQSLNSTFLHKQKSKTEQDSANTAIATIERACDIQTLDSSSAGSEWRVDSGASRYIYKSREIVQTVEAFKSSCQHLVEIAGGTKINPPGTSNMK